MVENDKVFQIMVHAIIIILCIFSLFPFILLIVSSITDESTLIHEGYSLIPKNFSIDSYVYLLHNATKIIRAYLTTIGVSMIGTLGNLALTILLAYPLSRRELPHRGFWSFLVFFTMLFNGGVVSSYIIWTQYFHIKNTYFALIIPNLFLNAFYIILMRIYFAQNIPEAILEAARIDGADEWFILRRIIIPMSHPIIATLVLFVGLQYWNDWINGLYYLTDNQYFTIQILLNKMLQDLQFLFSNSQLSGNVNVSTFPSLGIKMSIAVIVVVPELLIYPFFQRYFVKGLTIGSIKG